MPLCIWAEFLLAEPLAGTSCTMPIVHGSLSWLAVDSNPSTEQNPSSKTPPSFSRKLWVASTGWPKATGVIQLFLRATAEVIQCGKKWNRKVRLSALHYSLRLWLKTNGKHKTGETTDSRKKAFNISAPEICPNPCYKQIHAVVQFPKWQWNWAGCTVLALKVATNSSSI